MGVAASPDRVVEPYFDELRQRAADCAEWLGEVSTASLVLSEECRPFSRHLRTPFAEVQAWKREHPFSEAKPPAYQAVSGAEFLETALPDIRQREESGQLVVRGSLAALGGLRLLIKYSGRQKRRLEQAIADSR